jgi:hypothetical protein
LGEIERTIGDQCRRREKGESREERGESREERGQRREERGQRREERRERREERGRDRTVRRCLPDPLPPPRPRSAHGDKKGVTM